MEINLAYDSGDNVKNASLLQRISEINSTLGCLKRQLYAERRLLNQQKREMKQNGWSLLENDYLLTVESRPTTPRHGSTLTLNKEQLKEIERRCEEELEKLDEYIFNVNEFKSYWIQLREAEKAKLRKPEHMEKHEYMENTFSEKKYPRGKIFYVDSDLY